MSIVSLNPGPLFNTPGFNQTYTPVGLTASERDIREHFQKEQFSKRYDWPPESPVAEVYDIQNSPAKMVLLNNRAVPRSASHLRGQTDRVQFRVKKPNPDRHTPEMYPKKNPERHLACKDSSSPRFVRKPKMEHMLSRFSGKSTHKSEEMSSYGGSDPHGRYGESAGRSSHSADATVFTVKNRQRRLPISMQDNKKLLQTKGNKVNASYLLSIAQVYDVSKEKEYKQLQYKNLMLKELLKGFHKEEEFQKYLRYLDGPRKRPFSSPGPNKHTRKHSPKRERLVDKNAKIEKTVDTGNDVKKNKARKDTTTSKSGGFENENETGRNKHEAKRQISRKRAVKESRQQSEQKTTGSAISEDDGKDKNDRPKITEKTRKIRRKKSDEALKIRSSPKLVIDKHEKSDEKHKAENPQIVEKPATAKKRITFLNEGTESSPVSRIDYTNSERDKGIILERESLQAGLKDNYGPGTTVKDESVTDDEVSSTGQSTDDPETFTLQGPEGTTRPKSRLGNRPLLTNEEYIKLFSNRRDDQKLQERSQSEETQTGSSVAIDRATGNKSVSEEKRRENEKNTEGKENDKKRSTSTNGLQDTKKELPDWEQQTFVAELATTSQRVVHKNVESDEDDYKNGNASSEYVEKRKRALDQMPDTEGEENEESLLTEHQLVDDETKNNETWQRTFVPGTDRFSYSKLTVDREKIIRGRDNLSQRLENAEARHSNVEFSTPYEDSERYTRNTTDKKDAEAERKIVPITSNNDLDVTGLDKSAENLNKNGNVDAMEALKENRNSTDQKYRVNTRDSNESTGQFRSNDRNKEMEDGLGYFSEEIDTWLDNKPGSEIGEIKHELREVSTERDISEGQVRSHEIGINRELSDLDEPYQQTKAEESRQIKCESVEHEIINKSEEETGTEKEIKTDAEFEEIKFGTKYDEKEIENQPTNEATKDARLTFNIKSNNEQKVNDLDTSHENGFDIQRSQEESAVLKWTDHDSCVNEESSYKGTQDTEYQNLEVQKGRVGIRTDEHSQLDKKDESGIRNWVAFEEGESSDLSDTKTRPQEEITDEDAHLYKEEIRVLTELEKSLDISEDGKLITETKQGESIGSIEKVDIENGHERTDNLYNATRHADDTKSDECVDDDGKLVLNIKSGLISTKTGETNVIFQNNQEDGTEVNIEVQGEVDTSEEKLESHSFTGEEFSAAETAEKFVKDIFEKCSTGINSISEQQQTGDASPISHSVGHNTFLNIMNNTKNTISMKQEEETLQMTDEKSDIRQNHPFDESAESETNIGFKNASNSPYEETLTFMKNGKFSDSDSDRDFGWIRSREGTTRPKSRLGNRASLSKEIQYDDEKSSASSSQTSSEGFLVRSGYIDESHLPNMDTESSGSSKQNSSDYHVGEENKSNTPVSSPEQGDTKANASDLYEAEVTVASIITAELELVKDEQNNEDESMQEDRIQIADEERSESQLKSEQTEECQKPSLDLLRSVLDADIVNTTTSGDREDKEEDFAASKEAEPEKGDNVLNDFPIEKELSESEMGKKGYK